MKERKGTVRKEKRYTWAKVDPVELSHSNRFVVCHLRGKAKISRRLYHVKSLSYEIDTCVMGI